MPEPSVPPPLRVREADGSPNVIPVFDIIVSNGTVTKVRPGVITLGMGTGASGAPGASGGMAIGSGVTFGSAGAVLFVGSSATLAQDPDQLFWNETSLRLGIGTSTPAVTLHVVGSSQFTSAVALGIAGTSAGHAVRADRSVAVTYPLAGGGDLTADRTHTVDTAFLVNTARTLNTTYPLAGGGNLSADRTLTADTAFLVTSARTITAGVGLTGGGNLGADRILDLNTGATGQYMVTSAGATEGIAWINTAGVGGGPVYAPTGGTYIVFSADTVLSAEKILTAGSSVTLVTDATAVYINALTNAAATNLVYAPTGGEYVTYIANGTLTAEKVLTAGSSVTLVTDGTAIYINALTNAAGGTIYAPTGGFYVSWSADTLLSAEKTLTAGSSVTIVTDATTVWINALTNAAGGVVYAPTGGNYLAFAADANLTAERVLSTGTPILYTDTGVAGKFVVNLSAGPTGTMLVSSVGAIGSVAWVTTGGGSGAPTDSPYLTWAADGTLSAEKILTGSGLVELTTSATQVFIGTTAKTVKVPMALLTVQPDSGNAFWSAKTGVNIDVGYVNFVDGGNGIATWWMVAPYNLSVTPNWNLELYSIAGTATAAGSAVYTVNAKAVTHGEDLDAAAYTIVASAQISSIFRSNTLTISAVSGGTFDAVVALSSQDLLLVEVTRHGGDGGDTVGDLWNVWSVVARMDVV